MAQATGSIRLAGGAALEDREFYSPVEFVPRVSRPAADEVFVRAFACGNGSPGEIGRQPVQALFDVLGPPCRQPLVERLGPDDVGVPYDFQANAPACAFPGDLSQPQFMGRCILRAGLERCRSRLERKLDCQARTVQPEIDDLRDGVDRLLLRSRFPAAQVESDVRAQLVAARGSRSAREEIPGSFVLPFLVGVDRFIDQRRSLDLLQVYGFIGSPGLVVWQVRM